MVVMDADRFGISQLHQLAWSHRGAAVTPSLCLLVTNLPEGSKAGQRIKAVAATQDGFELAELDLRERREGRTLLGLNQSGRPHHAEAAAVAGRAPRDHRGGHAPFCDSLYQDDPTLARHRGIGRSRGARSPSPIAVEYLDKS